MTPTQNALKRHWAKMIVILSLVFYVSLLILLLARHNCLSREKKYPKIFHTYNTLLIALDQGLTEIHLLSFKLQIPKTSQKPLLKIQIMKYLEILVL